MFVQKIRAKLTKLYHDVLLLVMNYLLCETLSTLDFGLTPIWLVVCRIHIRRAVDAPYVSNEHAHSETTSQFV